MVHHLLFAALLAPAPADTVIEMAPGVPLELVWVGPGSFLMGSGDSEAIPAHPVELTHGFWIGRYEVTWAQWAALMGQDDGRGQPTHPARRMTWHAAVDFLGRAESLHPELDFRLPTEAEWEYAARAGTRTPWSFGADADSSAAYAWTRENAGGAIQPVGTRRPNPWGLHDVHGNVWEWVADWYAPDYDRSSPLVDPEGPAEGTEKVRRGGSAIYTAAQATSWYRYRQPPGRGNGNVGFRVVVEQIGVSRPRPGPRPWTRD